MSKRKLFYLIPVFILLALLYLNYSVEIFSPPKILFSTPNKVMYQPVVSKHEQLFCYQAKNVPPALHKKSWKILVWNLHKGQDLGWQQQLDQFAQQADFLLLQEVTHSQQLNTRFALQFPTSLYASAFAYLDQLSGVNLLSKQAPNLYCAGSEEEPWIRVPKVGVLATYPLENGQYLLIANLHLVNFEWTPTNYQNQLTSIFDLVAKHQGPIILAGDFNSWNPKRLNLVRELALEHGLQEASFVEDLRLRFLNNPLDHIFSRGLQLTQATTAATQSSDHNPLFATFELIE